MDYFYSWSRFDDFHSWGRFDNFDNWGRFDDFHSGGIEDDSTRSSQSWFQDLSGMSDDDGSRFVVHSGLYGLNVGHSVWDVEFVSGVGQRCVDTVRQESRRSCSHESHRNSENNQEFHSDTPKNESCTEASTHSS